MKIKHRLYNLVIHYDIFITSTVISKNRTKFASLHHFQFDFLKNTIQTLDYDIAYNKMSSKTFINSWIKLQKIENKRHISVRYSKFRQGYDGHSQKRTYGFHCIHLYTFWSYNKKTHIKIAITIISCELSPVLLAISKIIYMKSVHLMHKLFDGT